MRQFCYIFLTVGVALNAATALFSQSETGSDIAYLKWNSHTIDAISKRFRVSGQIGSSFDFRIKSTDRSYNYKLRATWFTPEVIRASARYWQLRERLTDEQTRTLVAEAHSAGDTVILVEIDPREGSGVIPSNWTAFLRAKNSKREVKGTVSPSLRSVKALNGRMQRDYSYDIFWVVFPLRDEQGQPILSDSDREAELVVAIYDKQGKVDWEIPKSIRERAKARSF